MFVKLCLKDVHHIQPTNDLVKSFNLHFDYTNFDDVNHPSERIHGFNQLSL